MTIVRSLVIWSVLVVIALPAAACVDGTNVQETALQGQYGCWRDLYLWVWRAYALTDDSWDPAGISDACNVALPFAKVVNSAFLINYGLSDNYIPQWHSTEDYRSSSRAADNRFHGPFYQRFILYNGRAEADSETGRTAARDRTNLHCPLFDVGNPSNDVANRASVMVHESWHHWQQKHGFNTGHMSGPIGSCTVSGAACDWYYFHGSGAFDFGTLDRYDTNPQHLLFHSPYQIAVEFDADVAEEAQPWVPVSVTQQARLIGNSRLSTQFRNAVGYRIGNPRPF
jgi:hypothetical protein